MNSCYKCEAYPPREMIYCLECGARLDGENDTADISIEPEQETVICNMTAGQPTFVGSFPTFNGSISMPRSRTKIPVLITSIAVILTGLASSIYIRDVPIMPAAPGPDMTTAIESVQRGPAAGGAVQTKVKALLPLPPTPIATPEPDVVSAPKRPNIAMAPKQQPMRTRIEIVDGIDRCYAIPGGRRIPC